MLEVSKGYTTYHPSRCFLVFLQSQSEHDTLVLSLYTFTLRTLYLSSWLICCLLEAHVRIESRRWGPHKHERASRKSQPRSISRFSPF